MRTKVALSCGRVAHDTEERQTHPVVLSHNDLNVTTVASSGGSMGRGAVGAMPPE